MVRVNLNVPFSEKDEAKRLGACWDANCKVWFVPTGVSPAAFGRWLQDAPNINIRSESYFIAQTEKACWKCGKQTSVYGFILPAGHETLEPDDEDEEKDMWYQQAEPTIVQYVTNLPPAVVVRINSFSRHYRIDFSKTTGSSYWMNHCKHCGMKQGDFEMYCEPQGAFFPVDEHAALRIVLHAFAEPFSCSGDFSYGVPLFSFMRRA